MKTESGTKNRNGPKGASHLWYLTPFSALPFSARKALAADCAAIVNNVLLPIESAAMQEEFDSAVDGIASVLPGGLDSR